jgi:hypothetical protein
MQQLQSLRITNFLSGYGGYAPARAITHVFADAFRLLTPLHTLALARVAHIDLLLPHLVHAATLRHLLIEPSVQVTHESTSQVPSPADLYTD